MRGVPQRQACFAASPRSALASCVTWGMYLNLSEFLGASVSLSPEVGMMISTLQTQVRTSSGAVYKSLSKICGSWWTQYNNYYY